MGLSINELGRNRALDQRAIQRIGQADAPQGALPSLRSLDGDRLVRENIQHIGGGGVSENNRDQGFRAAFRDDASGTVVLARFRNGAPAPMHLLDGLPEDWILERDDTGRVTAVKPTVVAGFVRWGRFFTRDEAARAVAE